MKLELDDGTSLDASDVRAALIAHQNSDHAVIHMMHDNGAKLTVGFRDGSGVCLWDLGNADGEVTAGSYNDETITYGWSQIPFPPGSEIDTASVIEAATEFAATGERPTCVTWTNYRDATPVTDTGLTPEMLQAIVNGQHA